MTRWSPPNPWTTALLAGLLVAGALSGCLAGLKDGTEGPIKLAFAVKDDHRNTDKDPQRLGAWIADQTGRDVQLYEVTGHGAAVQALRFGHAHAAFLDGGAAWLGWDMYGLEAIAADENSDGRTHYYAQAWVNNQSDIHAHADLEGRNSCHTGWLKSAGMLMPMGYLLAQDIARVLGDPDDIASLQSTIDAFFGTAHIPEPGNPYYNYDGAFRCLTEGMGDVAFVKDTSYEDHCHPHAWCLPREAYRPLEPPYGRVPSHPVMTSPHLDAGVREQLRTALLALNGSPEGQSILADVLETPALVGVESEDHLGEYGRALEHIPGFTQHLRDEIGLETP